MGKIIFQKDVNGNVVYPVTIGDAIAVNGETLTAKATKLDGIESGAQKNVQSDWNATSGDAFIKNKPTIPAAQIQSDWNQTTTTAKDFIKNKPAIPTETTVSGWGFTKNTGDYSKPDGGIPKTDLAAAVQTSLGKADSALQPNAAITGATKCKITYDANGLVTAGANLAATDIPNLAASKITSGTFADERIASAATWNAKQDALTFTSTPSATNKVVTKQELDAAVAGASNYLGTVTKVSDLSTTAKKGDFYRVSTAWTGVHVGDILIAEQDNPAAAVITSGTNGYTCLHNEINTDTHDTNVAGTGIAVSGTRGNTISLTTAVQTTLSNADTDHTNLGGHTVGVDVPSDAKFTDTTYESKAAASSGTAVSLVTTGEKYNWNNKGTYSKPSGGIPKTDLASAVQTSLGKADTALQSADLEGSVADGNTKGVKGGVVYTALSGLTAALTNNTTTYSDSKIAAIVDIAAADTSLQ